MIATTGEMPVHHADIVECDFGRTVQAGLTDKTALMLDWSTRKLARGFEEMLASSLDLGLWSALDSTELVEWYPEPAFDPMRSRHGVVGHAVTFDVVGDEIDWD